MSSMATPMNLMALPFELRLMIYEKVFHCPKYEIRRRPINPCCDDKCQCTAIDEMPDWYPPYLEFCGHRECGEAAMMFDVIGTDMYVGDNPRIAADCFPCPQDLLRNQLDLRLLQTCRQIYEEARAVPFTLTRFSTYQVASLSNFLFCLKRWQIQSLRHLELTIPADVSDFHMEWNETLATIAAACTGLRSLSISIHVFDHKWPNICSDTFWDGGLLELDRLDLKKLDFKVVDQHSLPDATFSFTAGVDEFGVHGDSVHQARDRLRERYSDSHAAGLKLPLALKGSVNMCPLYLRNLIHLLPRRSFTHAELHQEVFLRSGLRHLYLNKDTAQAPSKKSFVKRNLQTIRIRFRRIRSRLKGALNHEKVESPPTVVDVNYGLREMCADVERPGDWLRRLIVESYAPFIESFPLSIPSGLVSIVQ